MTFEQIGIPVALIAFVVFGVLMVRRDLRIYKEAIAAEKARTAPVKPFKARPPQRFKSTALDLVGHCPVCDADWCDPVVRHVLDGEQPAPRWSRVIVRTNTPGPSKAQCPDCKTIFTR